MNLLAYDTSSDVLSIALYTNGKKRRSLHREAFAGHSSMLVPEIEKMIRASRFKLEELDVIAVGLGPGSFTGLRVGMAVAKTMVFALRAQIIGVSSLEARARTALSEDGDIAVALDAKKSKIYGAIYRRAEGRFKPLFKPSLVTADVFSRKLKKSFWIIGDESVVHSTPIQARGVRVLRQAKTYPGAEAIAAMAFERLKVGVADDLRLLEPNYLYAKDCNVVRKKKQTRA